MLIYFEDLKQDVQSELVSELVSRLAQEEGDDIGPAYLSEKAEHIINARNRGVEMDI